MSAEVLYPVAEVAKLWHCSRDHVYDQINKGRLKTVNLGTGRSSKTRIPESALKAFVAKAAGTEPPNPSTPPPPPGPPRVRRAAA